MPVATCGQAAAGRPRCSHPGVHPSPPVALQTDTQQLGRSCRCHAPLKVAKAPHRGGARCCTAGEVSNQSGHGSLATVADVEATLKERRAPTYARLNSVSRHACHVQSWCHWDMCRSVQGHHIGDKGTRASIPDCLSQRCASLTSW